LKALGYTAVEGYPDILEDDETLIHLLRETGQSMPSLHMPLASMESDPEAIITLAKRLGATHLNAPYLAPSERPTEPAGWRQLGARLEAVAMHFTAHGLRVGWHNHDFEFAPMSSGEMPIEALLETAPSVGWQADLAWVARAGQDPATWLARYAHRVTSLHVKDIAPTGECTAEDGWADLGYGTMPWGQLLEFAREAGITHFVMEHDNPADHKRFASRSIDSFHRLLST
ncbi:MAG: sugar phosphate isomerase/epimerase, partial [Pseudomonadota bacterium]